jgi:DNA polymerase III delta subunit
MTAEVSERAGAPAALSKLVKPVGQVRHVAVGRKELPSWLSARAVRHGIDLAPDASRALVETLGESPAVLDAALQQLGVAYPQTRITRPMVLEQFRGLGEQQIWDLCDRAFGKDLPGSIRSLGSLLDAREEPLAILGVIAARLRDLMRVKGLPESASSSDIAAAAGLRFEWQGRRYRDQARRFTMGQLVRIHGEVVEADRVMKSGAPGEVVLATLVTSVAAEG